MIENMAPASGRMYRETDTIINLADRLYVCGTQIGSESSVTFANSATANTQSTITFSLPTNVRKRYLLVCYNPSTATALTAKVMAARTINSTTVNSLLTTLTVAASSTISGTTVSAYSYLIEGVFVGVGLSLIVSNNTAIGSSGGYSAYFDLLEAD